MIKNIKKQIKLNKIYINHYKADGKQIEKSKITTFMVVF